MLTSIMLWLNIMILGKGLTTPTWRYIPGVNFINIQRAAFLRADPESAKKQ